MGWLRKHSHVDERVYYWNALSGLAQWEHPQVSFLTFLIWQVSFLTSLIWQVSFLPGVANKLKRWPS